MYLFLKFCPCRAFWCKRIAIGCFEKKNVNILPTILQYLFVPEDISPQFQCSKTKLIIQAVIFEPIKSFLTNFYIVIFLSTHTVNNA